MRYSPAVALKKICSVKSFKANVARNIREGYAPDQAVAISYAVLRKACGVKTTRRMSPKQIVRERQRRRRR